MAKVLIVDDEQGVCRMLGKYFSSKGFAVKSAFSGEQGLATLDEGPFDVVLIDILLPGIHGLEMLKRAKKLNPMARVAMITGLHDDDLRAEARAAGADAYVTKPFNFAEPVWSMLAAP